MAIVGLGMVIGPKWVLSLRNLIHFAELLLMVTPSVLSISLNLHLSVGWFVSIFVSAGGPYTADSMMV